MHNIDRYAAELNNYLDKITQWVHQGKMSFNLDSRKQTQGVIFSRKVDKDSHLPLTFNNNIVYQVLSQKHLGIKTDNRLSLEEQLRLVLRKIKP